MITRLIWGLGLALATAMPTSAGEVDAREALRVEMAQYLRSDNFAALEARYAKALASRERLPSGLLAANWLVRAFAEASPAQDSSLVAGSAAEFDLKKYQAGQWKGTEEKASRWLSMRPGSSLAAVLLSEAHLQHGLVYRGYGPRAGVPPQDLAVFQTKVQQALEVLQTRAAEGAKDPAWYFQMLRIARYQQWEPQRFADLLRRALALDAGQYDIYFAASEMLLPQWGGSMETLEHFASFAANHTNASDGQSLYARVYWYILPYFGAGLFEATRADWKRMKTAFDDLVKRYPDMWNLNGYAWFACAAGDQAVAKNLFSRIGDEVEPEIWKTRQAYKRCQRWAQQPATEKRQ